MKNNISPKQARMYFILICVVVFILLLLLFLISPAAGFAFLVVLVLTVCIIKLKKPELFDKLQFGKSKKEEEMAVQKREIGFHPDNGFEASLILIDNSGIRSKQITVDTPYFVIGRDKSCNYVITNDTKISRRHAIIEYNEAEKKSTIMNVGGNGTRLNGEWLLDNVPKILYNNDVIQIESCILNVQKKHY